MNKKTTDYVRLAEELAACQLYDMYLSLHVQRLALMFARSATGPSYQLELSSIVRCRFSMTPVDDYLPAVIGLLRIEKLCEMTDVERSSLALANDEETAVLHAFDRGRIVWLLRIDGDITIEVISLGLDILTSMA